MLKEKNIYLTKNGLQKVKKEYDELKKTKFFKVNGEEIDFLSSKDKTLEYVSCWEDIYFLEEKIMKLEKVLKIAKLIKKPSKNQQKIIGLGAEVSLKTENNLISKFTIVGTLEANPDNRIISHHSPLGTALIGRTIGDKIIFRDNTYIVLEVKYL